MDSCQTLHQVSNKSRFNRQLNCWSLRCSWSRACQFCSNYIFMLHSIPGFNILRKYIFLNLRSDKPRRETFKFWYFVRLILEILRGESMPNNDTWLQWVTHPKCRFITGPPYFLNSNMLSICPIHQLPNDITVHTSNMVVWCKTCCFSLLELCFIPVSLSRLTTIKHGLLKQLIRNMLQ